MNRFFLRHEAYIIQEANIPFFLFTHLLRGFFLLSVIVIMFWYSFSFYTMPSSSFLHFCRTFLLLLLFKFIILCQRHDIDESNKKERPVLQTKSSSNYIRIQKYVSNRIIHLIVGTCRQLETRNVLRICYSIFYYIAIKSRVSLHFCHCQ